MSQIYYCAMLDAASLVSRTRINHGHVVRSVHIEAAQELSGRAMVLSWDGTGDDRHLLLGFLSVNCPSCRTARPAVGARCRARNHVLCLAPALSRAKQSHLNPARCRAPASRARIRLDSCADDPVGLHDDDCNG